MNRARVRRRLMTRGNDTLGAKGALRFEGNDGLGCWGIPACAGMTASLAASQFS